MTSFVWIAFLASLLVAKAQDLDLFDALDDKVTEKPKVPVPAPPPKGGGQLDLNDAFGDIDLNPTDPKKPAGDGFDLADALGPGTPTDPKKPSSGDELDLNDAFGGSDPEPEKPAVVPPKDGGTGGTGGNFGDEDLLDIGGSDYKPDKGKGGARASDPAYDPARDEAAGDQPTEANSGPLAGIISAVGVALVGAASSFFAYQKKKLCFKMQGGADPESGKHHQGTESEPQVLSNLLRSS